MRSELTPTEYAEHIQRRQEIWEAMYDQSEQVVPVESKREDGKGHRHEGFAESTAKATGKSERSVTRNGTTYTMQRGSIGRVYR